MDFELPLGVRLREALGEPAKVAKNQCVCPHLDLGAEWTLQGRPRRVPNKIRELVLASHLRRSEYQNAQDFTSVYRYPSTKMSAKLYSHVRDVMSPNHDRGFQDINLSLSSIETTLSKHVVRVFDLEMQEGHARTNVHQFGDADPKSGLDTSIGLLMWRGHMRFLMPSKATRPTSWRYWAQQVGEISAHEWTPWSDVMAIDSDQASDLVPYPCKTCFKPCRFAPPELQADNLNVVGGLQPVGGE